ncbi:MAG: glycerate kinase, partial [Acidimicrobiia bacterium]
MRRGLERGGVERVLEIPLADGGEGTLDVIVAVRGGARRTTRVTGPLGDPVDAEWAMLGDGTAIVEMAR